MEVIYRGITTLRVFVKIMKQCRPCFVVTNNILIDSVEQRTLFFGSVLGRLYHGFLPPLLIGKWFQMYTMGYLYTLICSENAHISENNGFLDLSLARHSPRFC